MGIHIFIIWV